MPWEHCDATVSDDAPCPACGTTKAQWTIDFKVTRQFRVTRRTVLRLSVLGPGEEPLTGAAWTVDLPDGRRVEGALDDLGTAKTPCPATGRCVVTFPGRPPGSLTLAEDAGGGAVALEGGDDARFEVDAAATLRLRAAPAWFEVELRTHGGRPRAGVEVQLHLPDGTVRPATTDAEGVARWEDLPDGELTWEAPDVLRDARWGADAAGVGEPVDLHVTADLPDGTAVTFTVLEHDEDGNHDPLEVLEGTVEGGRARATWTVVDVDDDDDLAHARERVEGRGVPEFVFRAVADGETSLSPLLRYRAAGALTNARWGQARARFDDPVQLLVDAPGLPDGAWVTFDVLEHDADGVHDPVASLEGRVREGRVEVGWHLPRVADDDDAPTETDLAAGFAAPELFFVARHGEARARCGELLLLSTDLVLPLRGVDGAPLADMAYELRCGGAVRRGRTDAAGVLRETGVGPDFTVLLEDGQEVEVRATEGAS